MKFKAFYMGVLKYYILSVILLHSTLCCGLSPQVEQLRTKGKMLKILDEEKIGPLFGSELTNVPLGWAYIYKNKRPDIFVMSKKLNGDSFVLLYPWIRDTENDVPIFGNSILCKTDFSCKYRPKYVFEDENGVVKSIWMNENDIVYAVFDVPKKTFFLMDKIDIGEHKLNKNEAMALLRNPDDSAELIFSVSQGDYLGQQKNIDFRSSFFIPFDGSGIWRGQIPKAELYAFTMEKLLAPLTNMRLISHKHPNVLFSYARSLCIVNLGVDRERDLIGGGQQGNLHYYHNRAKEGILFDKMCYLAGQDGIIIRHPTIDASPISYPNAKTGMSDIIAQGMGWMYYYKFSNKFLKNGSPVFEEPSLVMQVDAELNFGELPVISIADWDGDGRLDIISGNADGYVLFAKNVGSKSCPKFAAPEKIKCFEQPIHIQAGYRGSVQGPLESRWGYSCPRAVDWNKDGLIDLVLNSNRAEHNVYMNEGTCKKYKLSLPKPIYNCGLNLHGTWRNQPWVGTLDNKTAYICLDDDDELHLYWRIDNYNVEDGGKLELENGEPIKATYRYAGGKGRLKINVADWDGDGKLDLIIGTVVDSTVPDIKFGLPGSLKKRGASVLLLRNKTDNSKPVFQQPQILSYKGEPLSFGCHSCSPAIADINGDGENDLLVAQEIGGVLFFESTFFSNPNGISFENVDISMLNNQCKWIKGAEDGLWHSSPNWWRGVPTADEQAIISERVKVSLYEKPAQCLDILLGNQAELELKSGDVLKVKRNAILGISEKDKCSLIVSGGRMDVGRQLVVGNRKDAMGHLHLRSGVISADELRIATDSKSEKINIENGSLILNMKYADRVEDYITNKFITAFGGKGDVVITPDSANSSIILTGVCNQLKN